LPIRKIFAGPRAATDQIGLPSSKRRWRKCLFFRIPAHIGRPGCAFLGTSGISSFFLCASGLAETIRGRLARFLFIFGSFWAFWKVADQYTFIHVIFLLSRFPKPYVLSADDARFSPPYASPRPWKAEPRPERIFSTAIQNGRKKSAILPPHQVEEQPTGSVWARIAIIRNAY